MEPSSNIRLLGGFLFVYHVSRSSHFLIVHNTIKHNGNGQYCYHYATILTNPVSKIIDRRGCLVKLSNRELYQPDFSYRFVNFLASYGLKYKSISRLDLCYDCNRFVNGLSPRRLINSFLSGRYLKNCQPSYTIQADTQSDKRDQLVDAIEAKIKSCDVSNTAELKNAVRSVIYDRIKRSDASKCKLRGSARNVRDINYVSFGSHASSVCSYLYNKTKELREVKDKPYIRQLWKLNGIDETSDVWRVEISIKKDSKTLLELSTGEIFSISTDMLKLQADIEDLFYTYAAKYFDFRINDLTKNKSRMKSVAIFEHAPDVVTKRPIRLTLSKDTTKADKIFIRRLVKAKRDIPFPTEQYLDALRLVTHEYVFSRSLAKYLHKVECEGIPI